MFSRNLSYTSKLINKTLLFKPYSFNSNAQQINVRKFSSNRSNSYSNSSNSDGNFTGKLLLFGNIFTGIYLCDNINDKSLDSYMRAFMYGIFKCIIYAEFPFVFWIYAIFCHYNSEIIKTKYGYLKKNHIMLHFIPNSINLTANLCESDKYLTSLNMKIKYNEYQLLKIAEFYKYFQCIK
jgi:hypothetical protein